MNWHSHILKFTIPDYWYHQHMHIPEAQEYGSIHHKLANPHKFISKHNKAKDDILVIPKQ
ncbi:hypothetical protein [Paenibacillus periandrae]|uniref:hypothetical protein n=1 Tax=Paenibacillus periandrae TaxID=1761741 RepID=UPI001F09420E|nr:hypothetical protein [Paenibacillus periandrae]